MRCTEMLRQTISCGVVGLLAVSFAAPGAMAQESPAPEAPANAHWHSEASQSGGLFTSGSNRVRLGVFLQPGCEIAPGVEGDCAAAPVVASVIDGAPAARAGVEPGDTLLSLDGVTLRSEAGRRRMAQLEEGVPIRLEVGRGDGRETIEVTPTARTATAVFRMNGTAWRTDRPAPPSNVQVYRFRSDDGTVAEFHVAPVPAPTSSSNGFVVISEDVKGNLRLSVGDPDVAVHTLDGQRVELAELQEHLGKLQGELAGLPDGSRTIETEVEVRSIGDADGAVRNRLILDNPPLASRLQSVHEHALVEARARIDSVMRQQAALARRGELPPGAAAGYAFVVPSPEAPEARVVAPVPLPDGMEQRLIGAEFRALTPELADYFAVDEGLLVLRVVPETPAHRLGLRGGDVVIEVGERKLPDVMTFRHLVAESQAAHRPLEVKWNRKGMEMSGKLAVR